MEEVLFLIPPPKNERGIIGTVNYPPLIEVGASWSIFATEQVYPGSTGSPFPDK